MPELNNKYWLGLGNQPAGTNGGLIASVDQNGTLTAEYTVDEQGVHDMHLHDGKLYVPGTDPTDDWTLGNLYIRGVDGTWAKRRTLPNVIHTWGVCHDGSDNLWAAVGAHAGDNATWEGRVLRSTDDGLTWDQNILVNDYRVYDIAILDGVFYAIGYTSSYGQNLYESIDGAIWSIVDEISPYRLGRFVEHNSKLICIDESLSGLIVIEENITNIDVPFSFLSVALNCIVSGSALLYCVDSDGYIWMSDNLVNWSRYSHVNNAISIGYWPSQNCLVCSDMGANAKLWKIAL